MRVLVHARNTVDPADLWPYVDRVEPSGSGVLLHVEVLDGRELVGVLVALVDRGVDVVRVEPLGDTPPS